MKTLFQKSLFSLAIVCFSLSIPADAAQYFVVIGAFSDEPNAEKFTKEARTYFEEVSWSYHEQKNLFYVHVMKTSRQEEAKDWSLYIKQQTQFKDAWVLSEAEGESPVYASANAKANAQASDQSYVYESNNDTRLSDAEKRAAADLAWTPSRELSYTGSIDNVKNLRSKAGFSSAHVFKFIIENHIGNPIDAEVKLVDFAMLKKIASFKTGEQMAVRGTKREQVVTFVCDVLGYAMETRMFNLDHLSRSKNIRLNREGVWEVHFKLKPMAVNDISFMHKTTFYENSAVLNPSSKDEMNELLALLKSREGYRIVIHSHCNPGGKREMILPGKTKNYFDLQGTVKKSGSDKKLTAARAEVVRDFLLDNGIDKDRLRAVGWGSDDLLTPATAKDAGMNERIEIELVDL